MPVSRKEISREENEERQYVRINLRATPFEIDYTDRMIDASKFNDFASDFLEPTNENPNPVLPGFALRGGENRFLEKRQMIEKNNGIVAEQVSDNFLSIEAKSRKEIAQSHVAELGHDSPLLSLTYAPPVAAYWANYEGPKELFFIEKPKDSKNYWDPRTEIEGHNLAEAEIFAINKIPKNDIAAFAVFGADNKIIEIYIDKNLDDTIKENIIRCMLYGTPNPNKVEDKLYRPNFRPEEVIKRAELNPIKNEGFKFSETYPAPLTNKASTTRPNIQTVVKKTEDLTTTAEVSTTSTAKISVQLSVDPASLSHAYDNSENETNHVQPTDSSKPAVNQVCENFRGIIKSELKRLGEDKAEGLLKQKIDSLKNLDNRIKDLNDIAKLKGEVQNWIKEISPSDPEKTNYAVISSHRIFGISRPDTQRNFDDAFKNLVLANSQMSIQKEPINQSTPNSSRRLG